MDSLKLCEALGGLTYDKSHLRLKRNSKSLWGLGWTMYIVIFTDNALHRHWPPNIDWLDGYGFFEQKYDEIGWSDSFQSDIIFFKEAVLSADMQEWVRRAVEGDESLSNSVKLQDLTSDDTQVSPTTMFRVWGDLNCIYSNYVLQIHRTGNDYWM
ncbi:hypothetical protein Ancab_012784 [Ancistrocladus abbreviatus]